MSPPASANLMQKGSQKGRIISSGFIYLLLPRPNFPSERARRPGGGEEGVGALRAPKGGGRAPRAPLGCATGYGVLPDSKMNEKSSYGFLTDSGMNGKRSYGFLPDRDMD